MKYNNIDYQRCVLICMVVMIHIVNFSTLYPEVKNFINFFFLTSSLRHPKILIKEFSYFLMPCHQHGLRINLLV